MEKNSRTKYTMKNVKWGYICTLLSDISAFATRTILIWCLGANYNGVNGLFTNVLGVLSFAELGIGTALNFSLYKPIAENDYEKLKSIMKLYKKAYRIISLVITIFGIALVPFLNYLLKDPGDIGDIRIYYLIFLFTTVTSYFVSYKYSFANAKQENYIFSILNTVTKVATYIGQIIVLLFLRNFLIYLIIGAVIDLVQKILVSNYLDKRYPLLVERNIKDLDSSEKRLIVKNIKALIWHKIGEVSVHQTDNIIISVFVNVTAVGIVTYYTAILDAAKQLLNVALNAVVGSLGNVISTETKEKQYEIFRTYRFVTFWIYGFVSIAVYIMISKLVYLLVGKDMLLESNIVLMLVINFYMLGHRSAVNNMKVAGGIFQQDQFIALIQGGVNLVVSIVLVRIIGLPGVYIGTIVQGLIATIIKPFILYKYLFSKQVSEYFITGFKYMIVIIIAAVSCCLVDRFIFKEITWIKFALEGLVLTIIINIIFALSMLKTPELNRVISKLKNERS